VSAAAGVGRRRAAVQGAQALVEPAADEAACADSARAIALYERFGFVHEGTHRACVLHGSPDVDAHAMAWLHPSPPPLP